MGEVWVSMGCSMGCGWLGGVCGFLVVWFSFGDFAGAGLVVGAGFSGDSGRTVVLYRLGG